VLVLIAASRNTFKLAESRNAMNCIRRYAADDSHVIYGTGVRRRAWAMRCASR
jgi:cell division protein FtsZ